jgi:hypothetical protein
VQIIQYFLKINTFQDNYYKLLKQLLASKLYKILQHIIRKCIDIIENKFVYNTNYTFWFNSVYFKITIVNIIFKMLKNNNF